MVTDRGICGFIQADIINDGDDRELVFRGLWESVVDHHMSTFLIEDNMHARQPEPKALLMRIASSAAVCLTDENVC